MLNHVWQGNFFQFSILGYHTILRHFHLVVAFRRRIDTLSRSESGDHHDYGPFTLSSMCPFASRSKSHRASNLFPVLDVVDSSTLWTISSGFDRLRLLYDLIMPNPFPVFVTDPLFERVIVRLIVLHCIHILLLFAPRKRNATDVTGWIMSVCCTRGVVKSIVHVNAFRWIWEPLWLNGYV